MPDAPAVTSTNHILPFGELSPAQFERLCLWLVEYEDYQRVEHLGEAGSEQGRDIVAYLPTASGEQLWYFQCKRYKEIGAATLIKEVEKYNQHIVEGKIRKPHGIVFVTSAVLSADTRKGIAEFCQKHEYECEFWARTELDLKVKKHSNILKEFFNFQLDVPVPHDRINTARLPRLLTPQLFGRDNELALLDQAWTDPHTNILTFVAWGGVGKSALVSHWLMRLEQENYRDAERIYAWSFYSQGTSGRTATAEYFINNALRWFGGDALADQLVTASQWEKGEQLARIVRQTRTLLILDGLEPVQHPPGSQEGRLKEQSLQALLRELAVQQSGLCIITTREAVSDLTQYEGHTAVRHDLSHLSPQAGAQLLRELKVKGTDAELEAASQEYGGHSLALTLLGSYLGDVYSGDVRRRHEVESLKKDVRYGNHAEKVMRAYEKWLSERQELAMLDVLRLLGLFDRPADAASVTALRAAAAIPGLTDALTRLDEKRWQQTLSALRRIRLLAEAEQAPDTLDAHPIVREHFRAQLKSERPEAWRAGNNRLYEHLKNDTEELPNTIEGMLRLYAAVEHGCEAEKHQEALDDIYWRRILRKDEHFSWKKLGAFGAEIAALRGFFETPWQKPVLGLTDAAKAFVLGEAGLRLKALGRLKEAIQPMRAGLEAYLQQEKWSEASVVAHNLSDLHLITGDIKEAIASSQQSVKLADRSGDIMQQMIGRATLAHDLHQAGQLTNAESMFSEAREKQREWQPEYPNLYSSPGFRYCDLLLDQGNYQKVQEYAVWMCNLKDQSEIPLSLAQSNLLIGKAYLLQLQHEGAGNYAQAVAPLKLAMEGLMQTGDITHLPMGLLARAALYRLTGDYLLAQCNLEEAIRIVARNAMRLQEADCYLEAARLSLATGDGAIARTHWEQAKAMIKEMGYFRRDREVADLAAQLS